MELETIVNPGEVGELNNLQQSPIVASGNKK